MNPTDDGRYVGLRRREPAPERIGPHMGPFRITPIRATLGIALCGALIVQIYGLTVRDSTQMPVLTAAEVINGAVFVALAIAGAYAAYRQGTGGRARQALLYALLGGVAALVAAGSFAAAVILALVSHQ
jgi:predicted histidine transporter YuiF (NhaC family)